MLDRRTLNRTLLRRQGLLERTRRKPLDVVEALVGLQAQEPPDPYVALWSRIDGFDPEALSSALEDRRVVRIGLLRTTLHLVTADDARLIAPHTAMLHARVFGSTPFAKALAGLDLPAVVRDARSLLAERPRTPAELGRELGERWPGRDATALAAAARYYLPLVQIPPRGRWRRTSRTTNALADGWLSQPLPAPTAIGLETIVRRYLAAFGPATTADIRTWSGLPGLRPVVERLRPELRTFRDEAGRELLDVPDGPIEAPDVPAPVRFLPQYDNLTLSHADRRRIVGDRVAGHDLGWKGSILLDGFVAGAWRIRRSSGGVATMTVETFEPMAQATRAELASEAERLSDFAAGDADRRELRVDEAGER
jgi:hypothetical protein